MDEGRVLQKYVKTLDNINYKVFFLIICITSFLHSKEDKP